MRVCFLSIDVEKKDGQKENPFEGVENLDNILNIFRKHNVNATLFVTGEALERYPDSVKKWAKDFEIGCHNYRHITLDKLSLIEREKQIKDFVNLYKNIFKKSPKGFRAPRNIIDNDQFPILERYVFLYDSSVFPRYPWRIRCYEGYRGRAPVFPYWPSKSNYRKKCPSTALSSSLGDLGVEDGASNKLLEIPESPAFADVPLVGTWIRKLGLGFFKKLFWFKKPKFITFNMHSWDGVEFEEKGSKNSGKAFIKQLDEMLEFLKEIGYEFKNGEQIYEEFSKNK